MAAYISENTQYVGTNGKPLTGGKLYIGIQNQDPTTTGIALFSDRDLTTSVAVPVTVCASVASSAVVPIPEPL